MIRLLTALLPLAFAGGALAADPARPPEKTLPWTASFVSTVKIPTVLFENEPIGSAMDYLLQAFPPEFRPEIDFSRIKPERVKPIKFTGRNVTLLYAVSAIAEQLDGNVLIEPGKVVLVPKEPIPKAKVAEPEKKETAPPKKPVAKPKER